jgi:pentatricopeptide repeat protein
MTADADPSQQDLVAAAPEHGAPVAEPPAQPAPVEETHADIWERVKDHKVIQWAIAYLGAALAIGQAQELLANAFEWPNFARRVVVLTLVVGLPIAVTVAWYHGHRALRRVSVGELSILSALTLLGALVFVVALRRDEPASSQQSAAAAALPATAPSSPAGEALPNKVAVLPCENQSPDPNDAYFASGLHQDIIWQLDKLKNLNAIPRLTVLRYADTQLSVAEIATELSVRALLGCTIRYADNRVRITAELVDSSGLTTLWQMSYEPSLTDIADVFAVQADIAMNIAGALSVVFTPAEQELLTRPPTVSTEAYVLFLKALEAPGYDETIELFEQALAADEQFAAPRAALAFLWATQLSNTSYAAAISAEARDEHEARVHDYAARALALDPRVPYARAALTITEMLSWRWTDAYARIVQARELTPNDVTQYDLYLLAYLGRHDEALGVVRRGEQLYPGEPDNWRGWALAYAGRYDEAAAAFAANVARAPGEQGLGARTWLALMEVARDNSAAALEQLRLSETIAAAERPPLYLSMWAYGYGRLGQAEDARRLFAEMEQRETSGTRFGVGGWAMAALAVGDRQRALDWLDEAADKAAGHELDEGFFNLMALRANVTNDAVLRQPEFTDVLNRIKGE